MRRSIVRSAGRLRPDPVHVLGLVLLIAALCRSFRLKSPGGALIFDESYYVNAARIILGWHVRAGAPYAGQHPGLDPNHEHPALGKLLIAGSMRLFGDNGFGWRLPSLVAGLAAIILIYAIVRAAGGDGWLGVLAATVFSLDNLVLVHSRIATLDMPFVAVLLLAVWFWMRGWALPAGVACAVAALIKLPALYGLGALLLLVFGQLAHERLKEKTWSRETLRSAGLLIAGFAGVWLLGLWLLDLLVTKYDNPFVHLRFMFDYGFSLSPRGGPANQESNPWQWLANEVQMSYLRVAENVTGGGATKTRTIVEFRGALNPVLIGSAPLALSYSAWRAWHLRDKLAAWVVAWFTATYLAYYPLVWLGHRTTYLFYFLPAVAAMAVAIAQLLRQARLPRAVTWGYLVVLLVAFADYYPFRRIW